MSTPTRQSTKVKFLCGCVSHFDREDENILTPNQIKNIDCFECFKDMMIYDLTKNNRDYFKGKTKTEINDFLFELYMDRLIKLRGKNHD